MDGAASHLLEPNDIHKLCIIKFECFASISKLQTLQDREACPPQKALITSNCICTTKTGKDGAALELLGPSHIHQFCMFRLECFAPVSKFQPLQDRKACPPQKAPITSYCICTTKMGKDGAALKMYGPSHIHQFCMFRLECFAPVSKFQPLQDRKACPSQKEPIT
jgi:hypothetical protein